MYSQNYPQNIAYFKKLQDAPPGCLLVLCANKAELPQEAWKVSRQEFLAFASENSLKIFEASASTGLNVNEVFIINIGNKQSTFTVTLLLHFHTRTNDSNSYDISNNDGDEVNIVLLPIALIVILVVILTIKIVISKVLIIYCCFCSLYFFHFCVDVL